MANQRQVNHLKKSVKAWNQWRLNYPETKIDLIDAHLSRAYLSRAHLSGAYLSYADLSRANLSGADLSDAYLRRAYLVGADLSGADLSYADLSRANLSDANLYTAQVLNTNFDGATLTGACIADWQIGSSTKLEGVKCDYIFRSYDTKDSKFTSRLPVNPDAFFGPGEFEKWIAVRKGALDTIDITFTEGIDWQAFFQSLQTVRQQHPEAVVRMQSVQEIDGTYVAALRLETTVEGEALEKLRALVESEVKNYYALQLAEARGEIKALERSLDKAVEKLAVTSKYNIQNVGNLADVNHGSMKATQQIYAETEKQSLAGVALEIQRLLKLLEKANPTATEAEQKALVTAAIPPTLRQQAVSTFQAGGKTVVEELLDTPYVNVAIAVIENWQTTE